MSDPVVVIGNGPVGQTTALLLARWGLHVVVLDQRAGRDPVGSRAICQQRDVLDDWASVGAGAASPPRASPGPRPAPSTAGANCSP